MNEKGGVRINMGEKFIKVLQRAGALCMAVTGILCYAGCGGADGPALTSEPVAASPVLTIKDFKIAQSNMNAFLFLDGGNLYGWGSNANYTLGKDFPELTLAKTPVLVAEDVADLACCGEILAVLKKDMTLWINGRYPRDGAESVYTKDFVQLEAGVVAVSNFHPSESICFFLKQNGELFCFGTTPGQPVETDYTPRLIDTGVSEMIGAEQNLVRGTHLPTEPCFKYLKNNTLRAVLKSSSAAAQSGEMKITNIFNNVKKAGNSAMLYINQNGNLYFKGKYMQGDTEKTADEELLVAKNVQDYMVQTATGDLIYLTQNGHLYYAQGHLDGYDRWVRPLDARRIDTAVKEIFTLYPYTLYYIKNNMTLWGMFQNNNLLGTGAISASQSGNSYFKPLNLDVVDYYDEPAKILSNVEAFSVSGWGKVARNTSGETFVWGESVKMSRPVAVGYLPNPDAARDQHKAQSILFDDLEEAMAYRASLDYAKMDFEDSFIAPTPWDEVFENQ